MKHSEAASLIVLSTVTTGWHDVVDVVAEVLIAAASCASAKANSRLETRLAHPRG